MRKRSNEHALIRTILICFSRRKPEPPAGGTICETSRNLCISAMDTGPDLDPGSPVKNGKSQKQLP